MRADQGSRTTTVPVRLRQVVLITSDLARVTAELETALGLEPGYRDEGVGSFGLENRVLAAGDCFIEVLTPVVEECPGSRYLARRGGRDGGYMAIFQFADRESPRRRAEELGVRIVWTGDLADISGTHLDPRDLRGAIISLDWADPPESWRWAGPAWSAERAQHSARRRRGGITSLEVAVTEPEQVAATWAGVLGPGVEHTGRSVSLPGAGQVITFVEAPAHHAEGIVACGLALEEVAGVPARWSGEISGVRLSVVAVGGT